MKKEWKKKCTEKKMKILLQSISKLSPKDNMTKITLMTVVAIATAIHGSSVPSTCHTQANCLALKHTYDACANMYTTHVDWKCESTKICSKASGNWTTHKSLSFKTKPSTYFYLGIVAEGGVINCEHPHDYTTTTGEIGSCVSSDTSYAHHKKCKGGDADEADEDKCLWKFRTPGIPSDAECNPPAPAAASTPPPNYPAPAPVYYPVPAPAPIYSAPAYPAPAYPVPVPAPVYSAPAYPVHPHNSNHGEHGGQHGSEHGGEDHGEHGGQHGGEHGGDHGEHGGQHGGEHGGEDHDEHGGQPSGAYDGEQHDGQNGGEHDGEQHDGQTGDEHDGQNDGEQNDGQTGGDEHDDGQTGGEHDGQNDGEQHDGQTGGEHDGQNDGEQDV